MGGETCSRPPASRFGEENCRSPDGSAPGEPKRLQLPPDAPLGCMAPPRCISRERPPCAPDRCCAVPVHSIPSRDCRSAARCCPHFRRTASWRCPAHRRRPVPHCRAVRSSRSRARSIAQRALLPKRRPVTGYRSVASKESLIGALTRNVGDGPIRKVHTPAARRDFQPSLHHACAAQVTLM